MSGLLRGIYTHLDDVARAGPQFRKLEHRKECENVVSSQIAREDWRYVEGKDRGRSVSDGLKDGGGEAVDGA